MSLYEYVVTRLCTFVVTFPAEHFTILVSVISCKLNAARVDGGCFDDLRYLSQDLMFILIMFGVFCINAGFLV